MSNVKTLPDIGKIKDEAAEWVVRVHGRTYKSGRGLSDEFVTELKQWLSQSSEHSHQFQKMLSGWDAMEMLEELADVLPIEEVKRSRSQSRRFQIPSLFSLNPVTGLLSASVVACLAVLISFLWHVEPEHLEFMTTVGEQASYSLEDGTEIRLNTDSIVDVEFSSDLRVVTLERGEAHFDVAKDPDRPFIVFAGDGMVMAVGTAFNVRHQFDDSVNVIVSEGTVKVFSGVTVRDHEPLMLIDNQIAVLPQNSDLADEGAENYFREVVLSAGEAAQYSQRRITKESLEEQAVFEELAWTDGTLVFRGESLEEALAEISRYTDRDLIIVDQAIGSASVGGRFKTDDLDALAYSLALGLDIQVSAGENGSILFLAK